MSNIFQQFWKFYIYNVNIISINNGSIEMFTFMPFTGRICQNVNPQVINSFDNKEQAWTSQDIFPRKFTNLHKCSVTIATFDYPPAIQVQTLNGNDLISGHDIDLLRGLSDLMNFTLDFKILKEPAAWGFLSENGSSGGVIKKVMEKEADIAIGAYYLTLTRAKFMSFSSYSTSNVILVIPKGIPLSSFEKLFSPFNFVLWGLLIATFIFGAFVIFLIRFQKRSTQEFVFGTNTGNPYLNMLNIILNGSQNIEPTRNFSRFLLMVFILFCIVIRTLYQAQVFKFLQTDQIHAEIQTIDELIAQHFDIYMYESFQELSKGLKIDSR